MIPERNRATCEFCHQELNVQANGVHQFTKGWVKIRSGGGGHGISLPEREPRWAHGYCIDRLASGKFSQNELFGTEPTNATRENNRLIHESCAVCGSRDAPFGDKVSLMKDRLGMWYCIDHRPQQEG
jgi:hypothetical protein